MFAEGGAALRIMAGSNVRTQISVGRMARECARREDGSIALKVGVEARVPLGPAGSPGRFDVPVTVSVKYDDKVVASRVGRTTAEIDKGEAQTIAQIIVDDLTVPAAMTRDYEIEVSLGAAKAPSKRSPAASRPPLPPRRAEATLLSEPIDPTAGRAGWRLDSRSPFAWTERRSQLRVAPDPDRPLLRLVHHDVRRGCHRAVASAAPQDPTQRRATQVLVLPARRWALLIGSA